ncbi:MAG: hypothetical protein L5657_09760 [Calditerricola sp.]|nr:hypothetical protein [Calditerricola sp.]
MSFESVWVVIDRITKIITLITFVSTTWTAIAFWRYRRQRKLVLDELRRRPGTRPGVLTVAVSPEPIATQVMEYVRQQPWGQEQHVLVQHVHKKTKALAPIEADEVLEEVRRARAYFAEHGCDVIHLFFRGPVPLAAMVGAELGNGVRVHVYQMNSQMGTYEDWGVLHRRGLERAV